jgi:hypothetical protein
MRNVSLAVLAIGVLFLMGCAPRYIAKDGPMDAGKEIELMVRPHQSLGIQATDAIRKGNVTVVEGPLSDKLMGEEYPGRIRWNGWTVNPEKKEFFTQFVRMGMYRTGEFMAAIIIDGKREELKGDTKTVLISSMGDFVADLQGNVYRIDRNQITKKEYRIEIVKKYGTRIGTRREIQGFDKAVRTWNLYQISEGEIFSPYGEKDIQRIARINPSYGLLERIIAKGKITISTNMVYTVASVALSVIEGMRAPTEGWDYSSQLPNREVMAAIIDYVGQFRLELIRQMNAESAKAMLAQNMVEKKSAEVTQEITQPKVETSKAVKKSQRKERSKKP